MDCLRTGSLEFQPTRSAVNPYLKEDLKESRAVSVNAWATSVFGMDKGQFQSWMDEIEAMNVFADPIIQSCLLSYATSAEESGRYIPFAELCNRIVNLCRGILPSESKEPPVQDITFVPCDKIVETIPEHDGLGAEKKPDILGLRKDAAEKMQHKDGIVHWSDILLMFELQFRKPLLLLLNLGRAKSGLAEVNAEGVVTEKVKVEHKKEQEVRKVKAIRIKRAFGDLLTEIDKVDLNPRPSTSAPPLPDKLAGAYAAVQTAGHTLELLSCTYGTRSHCICGILKDETLSLWFYDAGGIVYTSEYVSLFENFQMFAALIFGLASCTPEQFGMHPLGHMVPAIPYSLTFPPARLSNFTLALTHPLTGQAMKITLKDPLFAAHDLVGRRTFLYTVNSYPDLAEENMIMKFSYQTIRRPAEHELLNIAQSKNVSNLPEVHLWGDLWKLSDGVREAFLRNSDGSADYEDRTLRAIVYSRYYPVKELFAGKIELVPVMVDQMLDCLHDLFYKAKILHRDISINNIMYEVQGTKDDPYYVFRLIDFDMAGVQDEGPSPPPSTHLRGTLPFMAHELVADAHRSLTIEGRKPTKHLLRHDKESLFWTSVYSFTGLKDVTPKDEWALLVAEIKAWETGPSLNSIATWKESFCRKTLTRWSVQFPPPARCLRLWFRAWTDVFVDAFVAIRAHERELEDNIEFGTPVTPFDEHTAGGIMSRDHLKAILTPHMPYKQAPLGTRALPKGNNEEVSENRDESSSPFATEKFAAAPPTEDKPAILPPAAHEASSAAQAHPDSGIVTELPKPASAGNAEQRPEVAKPPGRKRTPVAKPRVRKAAGKAAYPPASDGITTVKDQSRAVAPQRALPPRKRARVVVEEEEAESHVRARLRPRRKINYKE